MADPRGYLVSIGGAEDKKISVNEKKESRVDFLQNGILKIVGELIHAERPIIEIITTATSKPSDSYKNYRDAFAKLGYNNVVHLDIKKREEADKEDILDRLKKCNAVMIAGGDQLKLSETLGGTQFLKLMEKRYNEEPFIIAGTSAGAAVMSAKMMDGGQTEKGYLKGEIELKEGFGLINNVIIDTHFDARSRFARLVQALASQPGTTGIGLSEDTGVIVEKGSVLKVIGSASVTIIDSSEVAHNNIEKIQVGTPISIGKLNVYILANSDQYDLRSKQFTPVKFDEYQTSV